jgi:thiamine biosynthesis lipoprotein
MAGCSIAAPPAPARYEYQEPHLGTIVRVVCYAKSADVAKAAAEAAFEVMRDVNRVMSDWSEDSELSRLSAAAGSGPRPVSPGLMEVLAASQDYARLSQGSFDITVGPLVRLWRAARKDRILPSPEAIAEARSKSGWEKLVLDRVQGRAELKVAGMRLDLGGIGKGLACDRALAAMKALGVTCAFVDTGGGMALGDPPPGKPGWRIAMLGDAKRLLILSNCGVATSGDTEQFVEIDGVRYSHLVDPSTGMGLRRQEMATVVAPSGMEADALTKPCCILGPEQAFPLLASRPGVHAWVQWIEGGRRKRAETSGFGSLTIPAPEAE